MNLLSKKTIRDVNLENQTVIVRCDFNVPINNGIITDNKRIIASLETINYLINKNCKIILLSHLSRIKSLDDIKSNKKTLKPVCNELQKLLPNIKIIFCNENVGQKVIDCVNSIDYKDIVLLENTRYNDVNDKNELVKKESKCDQNLGQFWASLANIFVNDAFGTAHRKHASNVGIAQNIQTSCIGFLIEKEILNLSKITNNPIKPVCAILGGAKVADKLPIIKNLVNIADKILICGGMAYTFLSTKGISVGTSLFEKESFDEAKEILNKYSNKIILTSDYYCVDEFIDKTPTYIQSGNIGDNLMALDIGPKTLDAFKEVISKSNTIFWNGPAGVFEFANFQKGTKSICEILKNKTLSGAFTLVGGGDSASAAIALGFNESDFSFISTGGGASLEFISGEPLPGIEIIQDK